MKSRSVTLSAFTPEEAKQIHTLLAIRVAHMMGRKLEEGDWAEVYCRARGIPLKGWSNLGIDIMHDSFGVEHKMYRVSSKGDISKACGTSFMHPSATRSFRAPAKTIPANDAMRIVLMQYAELIKERTKKVKAQARSQKTPDMRTGWLLWQESLRQFLYFEEKMRIPNPDVYHAEWHENSVGSGARKPSTNLWIFDSKTGAKRFSITTEAGAKIQPYFDVPPPTDPNIYIFTVIGEVLNTGYVRIWLTSATARELKRLIGSLDPEALSNAVLSAARNAIDRGILEEAKRELAEPFSISIEAHQALEKSFAGVSDEHRFQLLIEQMRAEK